MIVQQINLYQDSLKPQQRSISFYVGITLGLAFFISFGLINVFLINNLYNRHNQVEQKRQLLMVEQERVKTLEANFPKQELDPLLAIEVEQWQKKVESIKLTIELLNTHDTARSQGFSTYFQALANQAVSGVWLSMIHFDVEQQRIDFQGVALKSDRIPYFLQQLQQESVFQGRSFAQFQIDKSEQDPNLMIFKLSTHLEPIKTGKNVQ